MWFPQSKTDRVGAQQTALTDSNVLYMVDIDCVTLLYMLQYIIYSTQTIRAFRICWWTENNISTAHMLYIKYFPISQMAAAALQFPFSVSSSGMHQQSHPSWCEVGNFSWPPCLDWSKQESAEDHSTYLNASSVAMFSSGSSAFTSNIIGFGVVTAPNSFGSTQLKVPLRCQAQ